MPVAAPAPPRDYRAEFPIFRRAIYLNSCSLGALSTRSRAKVNECLDLWEDLGAAAWYQIWWGALAELRARYASLIGAVAGSVAPCPETNTRRLNTWAGEYGPAGAGRFGACTGR